MKPGPGHDKPVTCWNTIQTELDLWSEAGRSATFWWRDDDASVPSAQLDRLLDLAKRFECPLALSVVPAKSAAELRDRVITEDRVWVLQHGYSHRNFEAVGRPESELGKARKKGAVLTELRQGFDRLQDLYPERFLPVLVPPWGRIHRRLMGELTAGGWVGLSRCGPRRVPRRFLNFDRSELKNMVETNIHADCINWRGTPKFAGEQSVVDDLVRHLTLRRLGQADPLEPTGIMTHHLDHDAETWAFLDALLDILTRHPAATWMDAKEAFQIDV